MCLKKPTDRGWIILGYTTRRHLILDLDNTSREYAKRIAYMIMSEYPEVGRALILESAPKPDRVRLAYNKWGRPLVIHDRPNHHLVFDNLIGYNKAAKICRVLAGLGILEEDYDKIREFRGDMTLRVGPAPMMDGVKPAPKVVGLAIDTDNLDSDGYIKEYLRFKKIGELLFFGSGYPEHVANNGADDPQGCSE